MTKDHDCYNSSFYDFQMDGSYKSAVLYVKHLANYIMPLSVVDLGCGRGTWLKAFGEAGAKNLVGFDGSWNSQEKMLDQNISFKPVNLNSFTPNQNDKFDLAMSLEVAEHLSLSSARNFVSALTNLSDVVLFGAAYSHQGGSDHINEQPHTYWAKIFLDFGYVPYDIFRPFFWGNPDVEVWYQQNTFLYVKSSSLLNNKLESFGSLPVKNLLFMNCVHPHLFDIWVSRANSPFKTLMRKFLHMLTPKKLQPIARKINGKIFGD